MAVSKSALLFAFGALLLAAGFGLGTLFGGGPPEPATVFVERGPAPSPGPAGPERASPDSAPAGPAASEEARREALRAAIAAIPDREVPAAGTGAIAGRVRTADGKPLEGVEITASPEHPRPPRTAGKAAEPPPEPDPVDQVIQSVQWARWWKNAKRTALTDAAGEFRLEGLSDARHGIGAKKKGWQFRPKDWRSVSGAKPGAFIEYTATPSVEVRVEVSFADGRSPEEVTVNFSAGRQSTGHGWNPDNPVIEVAPGTYEVVVTSGQGQEYRTEPQTVEIAADRDPPVLQFVLKGRPGIRGRVIFPEGEESGNPQVYALRLTGDARPAAAAVRGTGKSTWVRSDGGEYRYSFTELPPGRYALGLARLSNGPVVSVEEVEVGEGPAERDLRMPPVERSEYVVLRVLGPAGQPLGDVEVVTGFRSKTSSSSGGSNVIDRPDGTKWVFHHSHGMAEDADAAYWISATSGLYGSKTAEYRKGAQDEVVIRFDEPARLEARIAGFRGSGYEGRLGLGLGAASAGEEPGRGGPRPAFGPRGSGSVSADGVQTFPAVQPGDYLLSLYLVTERMTTPLAKVPVSLRPGRNEASIPIPALYAITVTGAEGQVFVRRTGEDREARGFFLFQQSTEGKAVFDGLPEGDYEAQSGQKRQAFHVPGTSEVRL